MDDILKTLFESLRPWRSTEEETAALKETEGIVHQAEALLPGQLFDELWSAAMYVGGADDAVIFSLGFRLGMQLTLAGLEPVSQGKK